MSTKKTIKFKTGRLARKVVLKFRDIVEGLYGGEACKFVPDELYYTCFNDFCMIYTATRDVLIGVRSTRVFAGRWIGVYYKKLLTPSIPLVNEIFREIGVKAAIVVAQKGASAFLYGNDVLPESVVQVIPPNRGIYAVMDQSDGEVLGFARWNPRKEVYENIYDLGLYLRLLG